MAETKQGEAPVVKIARVFDIKDAEGGRRIKARLLPEDLKISDDEVMWAIPLMPKMFHIMPRVGEYVFIFTSIPGSGFSRRYYMGPIIPQEMSIGDSDNLTALATHNGAWTVPMTNPDDIPEMAGCYPETNDVAILGRKSCDIQVKENDIRLRAGVKKVNGGSHGRREEFNTDDNHAFIKLKYDSDGIVPENSTQYNSTATIVADKINLIGNKSKDEHCTFDTSDRKELITDTEMEKIMEKAHCLPYGDVLVEVLTQFYHCFANHTHPFSMLPPCPDSEMLSLGSKVSTLETDMLSDNVRIN